MRSYPQQGVLQLLLLLPSPAAAAAAAASTAPQLPAAAAWPREARQAVALNSESRQGRCLLPAAAAEDLGGSPPRSGLHSEQRSFAERFQIKRLLQPVGCRRWRWVCQAPNDVLAAWLQHPLAAPPAVTLPGAAVWADSICMLAATCAQVLIVPYIYMLWRRGGDVRKVPQRRWRHRGTGAAGGGITAEKHSIYRHITSKPRHPLTRRRRHRRLPPPPPAAAARAGAAGSAAAAGCCTPPSPSSAPWQRPPPTAAAARVG